MMIILTLVTLSACCYGIPVTTNFSNAARQTTPLMRQKQFRSNNINSGPFIPDRPHSSIWMEDRRKLHVHSDPISSLQPIQTNIKYPPDKAQPHGMLHKGKQRTSQTQTRSSHIEKDTSSKKSRHKPVQKILKYKPHWRKWSIENAVKGKLSRKTLETWYKRRRRMIGHRKHTPQKPINSHVRQDTLKMNKIKQEIINVNYNKVILKKRSNNVNTPVNQDVLVLKHGYPEHKITQLLTPMSDHHRKTQLPHAVNQENVTESPQKFENIGKLSNSSTNSYTASTYSKSSHPTAFTTDKIRRAPPILVSDGKINSTINTPTNGNNGVGTESAIIDTKLSDNKDSEIQFPGEVQKGEDEYNLLLHDIHIVFSDRFSKENSDLPTLHMTASISENVAVRKVSNGIGSVNSTGQESEKKDTKKVNNNIFKSSTGFDTSGSKESFNTEKNKLEGRAVVRGDHLYLMIRLPLKHAGKEMFKHLVDKTSSTASTSSLSSSSFSSTSSSSTTVTTASASSTSSAIPASSYAKSSPSSSFPPSRPSLTKIHEFHDGSHSIAISTAPTTSQNLVFFQDKLVSDKAFDIVQSRTGVTASTLNDHLHSDETHTFQFLTEGNRNVEEHQTTGLKSNTTEQEIISSPENKLSAPPLDELSDDLMKIHHTYNTTNNMHNISAHKHTIHMKHSHMAQHSGEKQNRHGLHKNSTLVEKLARQLKLHIDRMKSPWAKYNLSSVFPAPIATFLRHIDDDEDRYKIYTFIAKATDPFKDVRQLLALLENNADSNETISKNYFQTLISSMKLNSDRSFDFALEIDSIDVLQSIINKHMQHHKKDDSVHSNHDTKPNNSRSFVSKTNTPDHTRTNGMYLWNIESDKTGNNARTANQAFLEKKMTTQSGNMLGSISDVITMTTPTNIATDRIDRNAMNMTSHAVHTLVDTTAVPINPTLNRRHDNDSYPESVTSYTPTLTSQYYAKTTESSSYINKVATTSKHNTQNASAEKTSERKNTNNRLKHSEALQEEEQNHTLVNHQQHKFRATKQRINTLNTSNRTENDVIFSKRNNTDNLPHVRLKVTDITTNKPIHTHSQPERTSSNYITHTEASVETAMPKTVIPAKQSQPAWNIDSQQPSDSTSVIPKTKHTRKEFKTGHGFGHHISDTLNTQLPITQSTAFDRQRQVDLESQPVIDNKIPLNKYEHYSSTLQTMTVTRPYKFSENNKINNENSIQESVSTNREITSLSTENTAMTNHLTALNENQSAPASTQIAANTKNDTHMRRPMTHDHRTNKLSKHKITKYVPSISAPLTPISKEYEHSKNVPNTRETKKIEYSNVSESIHKTPKFQHDTSVLTTDKTIQHEHNTSVPGELKTTTYYSSRHATDELQTMKYEHGTSVPNTRKKIIIEHNIVVPNKHTAARKKQTTNEPNTDKEMQHGYSISVTSPHKRKQYEHSTFPPNTQKTIKREQILSSPSTDRGHKKEREIHGTNVLQKTNYTKIMETTNKIKKVPSMHEQTYDISSERRRAEYEQNTDALHKPVKAQSIQIMETDTTKNEDRNVKNTQTNAKRVEMNSGKSHTTASTKTQVLTTRELKESSNDIIELPTTKLMPLLLNPMSKQRQVPHIISITATAKLKETNSKNIQTKSHKTQHFLKQPIVTQSTISPMPLKQGLQITQDMAQKPTIGVPLPNTFSLHQAKIHKTPDVVNDQIQATKSKTIRPHIPHARPIFFAHITDDDNLYPSEPDVTTPIDMPPGIHMKDNDWSGSSEYNNAIDAMLILSVDDILFDHSNLHGALVISN